MRNYLLDTDTCIAFLQGKYQLLDKIRSVGQEHCYISEITVGELIYGAYFSSQFDKHITEVEKLKGVFQVVPIFECLHLFGKEKARLRRMGELIPDFDLLIGATSVHFEMIMVTNNEKHLQRISDIRIENWIKEGKSKES